MGSQNASKQQLPVSERITKGIQVLSEMHARGSFVKTENGEEWRPAPGDINTFPTYLKGLVELLDRERAALERGELADTRRQWRWVRLAFAPERVPLIPTYRFDHDGGKARRYVMHRTLPNGSVEIGFTRESLAEMLALCQALGIGSVATDKALSKE